MALLWDRAGRAGSEAVACPWGSSAARKAARSSSRQRADAVPWPEISGSPRPPWLQSRQRTSRAAHQISQSARPALAKPCTGRGRRLRQTVCPARRRKSGSSQVQATRPGRACAASAPCGRTSASSRRRRWSGRPCTPRTRPQSRGGAVPVFVPSSISGQADGVPLARPGGASCHRATPRPARTSAPAKARRAIRQRRLSARASSRAQQRAGQSQTAAATPAIQKPR